MNKTVKIILSISLLFLVYGCSFNSPFKTLYYETEKSSSHKNMIIFLRGRGGDHRDFESQGFVDEVLKRKLPFAMAAPNAHFGYYFSETLVSRLKIDIIEPAKLKGYEKFWLVGVSMGGLGSLMYARQHLEDIEGICLISPFLGYEKIISEIYNAGGLKYWEPGDYNPDGDWQRMFWHWLKQCISGEKTLPDIYLCYGTEDSFAKAHKLLENIIPAGKTISTPGGHTVDVMKKLWILFLDKNYLKQYE
ncbi:MAG: alpha/beta hydrolase [Desulfobacterales bacterium]